MTEPGDPRQVASVVADMVNAASFTTVRWAAGYDIAQVDNFLDDLIALARNGHPVESPAALVAFRPSRFREGYVTTEVDHFLDSVIDAVAAVRRGGPVQAPEQVPVDGQDDSVRAIEHTEPMPSVIQEQHGLLSRLFARRG